MTRQVTDERIDPGAGFLCDRMAAAGFSAYIVGGCLRDLLLGRTPTDWDLCTSATPRQVTDVCAALGLRVVPTGLRYGTVTALLDGRSYEITTLRRDGAYADGRRPDRVTFTSRIEEDLARRDFTVNAMAYAPGVGLIDPYGGAADCAAGIVRAVGDAGCRFSEDALRMLRAARFAAVLGFAIDKGTLQGMREQASGIARTSPERVAEELRKLVCAPHPELLAILADTGILGHILPELARAWEDRPDQPGQDFAAMRRIDPAGATAFELRLALLLRGIGVPFARARRMRGNTGLCGIAVASVSAAMARGVAERLRYPKRTQELVTLLIRRHAVVPRANAVWIKRRLCAYGEAGFMQYLAMRQALTDDRDRAALYDAVAALSHAIIVERQPYSVAHLAIKGDDLAALGFEGWEIGDALRRCCDRVIFRPDENEKEQLLRYARALRAQGNAR